MNQKTPDSPRPDMLQPHRAGDVKSFPGGKVIYLSPAPLDFNQTDAYLNLGGSLPTPFTWQFTLGLPFIGFLMLVFIMPVLGVGLMWIIGRISHVFYVGIAGLFNVARAKSTRR